MQVTALDHLVLTVADPEASAAWYAAILGMVPETFRPADGTTRLALKFGQQKINLHRAGAEFRPHAAAPAPGTADLCFLTDTALTDWQAHLAGQDIPVEMGPVARTGATGPITSIYIRDLDGNLIEISVLG
ncbi:MAG: VOC family protein [Pseudomonadota bacterium]